MGGLAVVVTIDVAQVLGFSRFEKCCDAARGGNTDKEVALLSLEGVLEELTDLSADVGDRNFRHLGDISQ